MCCDLISYERICTDNSLCPLGRHTQTGKELKMNGDNWNISLEQAWQKYAQETFACSGVLLLSEKNNFFAGAMAVLEQMQNVEIDSADTDGRFQIDKLTEECRVFLKAPEDDKPEDSQVKSSWVYDLEKKYGKNWPIDNNSPHRLRGSGAAARVVSSARHREISSEPGESVRFVTKEEWDAYQKDLLAVLRKHQAQMKEKYGVWSSAEDGYVRPLNEEKT